jgi:hypothetical protein
MTELGEITDFSVLIASAAANGDMVYNATRTPDQATQSGGYRKGPALQIPYIPPFIQPGKPKPII